jgi:hypothetical protein
MNLEVILDGIAFNVDFDYQSAEKETLEYPGCPASIDITGVKVQTVEVGEIISTYWLSRIEEELMGMAA